MSAVQSRRWTREEYESLTEAGIFQPGERVELIEGEIVDMPPQQSHHATGVSLTAEVLRSSFGPGFHTRIQLPLGLGERSEPEPDVAVVVGSPRDYSAAHPSSAVLVVEVSDTTLSFDRETKASVYAKAEIPVFWIVKLVHRQLEVYSDPAPIPEARYGFGYRTRRIFVEGDEVEVPAPGRGRVRVADLLP